MLFPAHLVHSWIGIKPADIMRGLSDSDRKNLVNILNGKVQNPRKTTVGRISKGLVESFAEEVEDKVDFFQSLLSSPLNSFDWKEAIEIGGATCAGFERTEIAQRILKHADYWQDSFVAIRNGDSLKLDEAPFPEEIVKEGFIEELESAANNRLSGTPLIVLDTMLDELMYVVARGEVEYNASIGLDYSRLVKMLPSEGTQHVPPFGRFVLEIKNILEFKTYSDFASALDEFVDDSENYISEETIRKWKQAKHYPKAAHIQALISLIESRFPDAKADLLLFYGLARFFQTLFDGLKGMNATQGSVQYVFERYGYWFEMYSTRGSKIS